jgi:long-chain acyl-CoA synthetase
MAKTIISLLRNTVSSHPNLVYMKERRPEGWVEATFREVAEEARHVAGFLLSRGLSKGDRVALLAEGRNSWVTAELGILMARGINVPISVKIRERGEILLRLRHSESRFAITSERHIAKIMELTDELPTLEGILSLDRAPVIAPSSFEGPSSDGSPGQCRPVPLWYWPDVLRAGQTFADKNPQVLSAAEEAIQEDDPATLTYTSGTTAEPKGILLSHKNYWVNASDGDAMYPLPEPLFMLLILPWDHSFAHTAGLFIFLKKASVIAAVEPGKNELGTIRNIPRSMKEVGPTYLLVVPALVENFRKNIELQIRQRGGLVAGLFGAAIALGTRVNGTWFHKRWDPLSLVAWPVYLLLRSIFSRKVCQSLGGRLVFMVSGGSACSVEDVKWFTALGLPVYQGYGLSETSPIISANTNRKGCFKIGSSGKPFPWVQIRIEGEDGLPVGRKETGEICVKGESVMLGYWRNEEATQEAINDGWFHTGDLGYLDEDGFIFIVGRIKSLLVGENGEKYSPETLEQHIVDNVPLISQVMLYNQQKPFTVALVVPDGQNVRELVAARNGEGLSDAVLDFVIEQVRLALLRYRKDPTLSSVFIDTWTPKTFALLPEAFSEENGTMNSSLKMVRRKIMERYQERIQRLYDEEEDPLNPSNRDVLRFLLAREIA